MERESPAQRIPEFIGRIAAIDKNETTRLWGTCMAEKRVLKRYGHTIASVRRVLTEYRNGIRTQLGVTHPALRYMRLAIEDMEELREDYRERVTESHQNLRPVDCEKLVTIATGVIRQADTQHPMRLAAALLLLTGRRVVEMLKTGSFAPAERAKALVFAGQVKTKSDVEADPYEIPVLVDPKLVLRAIGTLRSRADCSTIDNKKVNDRYSKYVNAAAAELFKDERGVALMPKDLRAVYATAAYAWYAPMTVSMNAYFARILGHSPLDLITSLSYVKFYPLGEKRAFVADVRWSLDAAIALQEEALDDETDETQRGYIKDRIATLQAVADDV